MQKRLKQFCAIFLAICVFYFSAVAVWADDSSSSDAGKEYIQKISFWHMFGESALCRKIIGYSFMGEICPKTEDGRHCASSYEKIKKPLLGDIYYKCICDYCGASFDAYESDLKQSYEAQVEEMPATGYNSEGRLIWNPFSDFDGTGKYYFNSSSPQSFSQLPLSLSSGSSSSSSRCSFELAPSGDHIVCNVSNYGQNGCYVGIQIKVPCPISGSYRRLAVTYCSYSLLLSSGTLLQSTLSYNSEVHYTHRDAGDIYTVSSTPYGQNLFDPELYGYGPMVSSGVLDLFFWTYEIIPDSFVGGRPDTYSSTTRPTSITGNYGIIGDDGKLIQVTGNTIVNETNNTYYNPATGQTVPITNWSYDYTDRSYTVTTEEGDSYTITYGDENVTINEGDTVYNIYYIVNGSGSGEGGDGGEVENPPPACAHSWTELSRTDPSCTVPGSVKSSCSKCDETKTDPLPALGHDWTTVRTVPTQYGEDGSLIQEGYTLYECSRCGTQYKDTDSTGPPGNPGDSGGEDSGDDKESIWDKIGNFFGSLFGGIGKLLEAVLGKLLDALASLAGALLEKLSAVIETVLNVLDELPKLFGGFLDFLGILFPFLPPEITLLLTFGVVAVVFAAIIKAIRS